MLVFIGTGASGRLFSLIITTEQPQRVTLGL